MDNSLSYSHYFYSLSSSHFIVFVAKEDEEEKRVKKVVNFGCSNNIAHFFY
jgi:hypothetical protein